MYNLVCFCAWFVLARLVESYRLPSTCLEVKSYLPKGPDGEFWLDLFRNNTKYRVYCHNLTSEHPKEFLTLIHPENNFAYSEKLRVDTHWPQSNDVCAYNGERLLYKKGGQTMYYKVKMEIGSSNLTIDTQDATFGVTDADSFVDYVPYASPESCYDFGQPGNGRFSVDLRGTGITISPITTWIADGFGSQMTDYQKQFDGQVVTATCGGWPGGCLPDPDFYIELHPSDVIAKETAEIIWILDEMTTQLVKFDFTTYLGNGIQVNQGYLTCASNCVSIEKCLIAEDIAAKENGGLPGRVLKRAITRK